MILGSTDYTKNNRLSELADTLEGENKSIPPLPKTRNLLALLIIVFITSLLFLATLYFAKDYPNLYKLLLGEGAFFTALITLAVHIARANNASLVSYDRRAAEWLRTDAIIRTLREMTYSKELSPKAMIDLLDALLAIYPPVQYSDEG